MSKQNKLDDELYQLMSFLAESVAEMNDQQIQEEFGNQQSRVKQIFKTAIKELDQQKLRQARLDFELASKRLAVQTYNIPRDKGERRSLFASIIARKPDLRALAFTAQHREFDDLTDADIESFLKQLVELGVLDDLEGK